MKIGVLSDTHISKEGHSLPGALLSQLQGVDLILHAGDLVVLSVLEHLAAIAPVEAVAGNMDDASVKRRLPRKKIIAAEQLRIGLIHGWGTPVGLAERILGQFNQDVEVIVFGHSHHPCQRQVGDTLLFNPGSAGRDFFSPIPTCGLLTVQGDRVTGEILRW